MWDLSDEFHDRVVTDFVSEYQAGRTPNPCVRCNEHIKFDTLLERAEALGFDAVATGHYARIVIREGGEGEEPIRELHRAADAAKDQSYVLAVMGPEKLKRAMFPLGETESKQQVRNEAAARLLGVSNKPDSYDICFVADGDTKGFLERALGENPGEIVDETGEVVGAHTGAYSYTVGQRKGLRLPRPAADGAPRYVTNIDTERNLVDGGPRDLAERARAARREARVARPRRARARCRPSASSRCARTERQSPRRPSLGPTLRSPSRLSHRCAE